jgi:hypothetical protein
VGDGRHALDTGQLDAGQPDTGQLDTVAGRPVRATRRNAMGDV